MAYPLNFDFSGYTTPLGGTQNRLLPFYLPMVSISVVEWTGNHRPTRIHAYTDNVKSCPHPQRSIHAVLGSSSLLDLVTKVNHAIAKTAFR
jgi:hypothetical protein